ncbi:hypothetical protein DyAD56_20180 [Dyella sp. AD56]|uniref:hypothetical protein n=1 Tax=Dyella sp. AD56 TaxID=1528744 RepID=UPI000C82A5CD|nr:hypothetical protein [Dyella sp. AD56]PMQ03289.1 hypothetical protein DyAD56_20180 [Dyella sp. AD56]
MREELQKTEFVQFIRAFLHDPVFTFAEDASVAKATRQPICTFRTTNSSAQWVQAFLLLGDAQQASQGNEIIAIRGGDLLSMTRGLSVAIEVGRKSLLLYPDEIRELLACHWKEQRGETGYVRAELVFNSVARLSLALGTHILERTNVQSASVGQGLWANEFTLVELWAPMALARNELDLAVKAISYAAYAGDKPASYKAALIVREPPV